MDFSAYDPNNYAKSLRIYAKEGDNVRSFEEFGTGEQQILLMAFAKAYMEVFTAENFVLIIEEPEAHLHPLAQKWLKEYIVEMCASGIQVVISTHSTDFIDAEYLDGLVRVYKEAGTTKAVQLSEDQLYSFCVESGVPASKTSPETIIDFYATKLFSDQLKGMFAEIIVLVEGATEFFALPVYLKRVGFSLAEHGWKSLIAVARIPLHCFGDYSKHMDIVVILNGDSKIDANTTTFNGIIATNQWETAVDKYVMTDQYAYFGDDFEKYFRAVMTEYSAKEQEVTEKYHLTSKPGKAKAVVQHCEEIPDFIIRLKNALEQIEMFGQ